MTYQKHLQNAVDELAELGIEDAPVDAWLLMELATGMPMATYYLHCEEEMPSAEAEKFRALMERRLTRIPVQLIIGSTEFMGLTFKVDGDTLIPRQDTEVLVEKVLEYASELSQPPTLLDLFTGSGCIAISLAHHGEFSSVSASDISEKALESARANATALDTNIEFRCGDITEPFEGETFDIITANPPYIRSAEIEGLMPEVKGHDPLLALDGGADGLIFYRRLANEAREHLVRGGAIFMEIGCDQAEDVKKILMNAGYRNIEVTQDYAGLDRVVSATY